MTASGAGVGRARQRTTLFVSRMCPLPLGLVCPRNGITEIDRIGESSELQTLTIRRNAALTRLPVFDRAPAQMVQVTVRDNAALQRGPSFPNLTQLYFFETPYYESAELEFTNNPLLTSIGDYPKLESLTMLALSSRSAEIRASKACASVPPPPVCFGGSSSRRTPPSPVKTGSACSIESMSRQRPRWTESTWRQGEGGDVEHATGPLRALRYGS